MNLGNVSKQHAIVKRSTRRVSERGNPLPTYNNITAILEIYFNGVLFMKNYRITDTTFRVFLFMCLEWQTKHVGYSIYGLSLCCRGVESSNLQASMKQCVERMHRKGMIEIVGHGVRKARMWAPTLKCLRELDACLSST